ncbi:unnamed protein product [Toxocara canis]|uniref:Ubiquitin-like domain-containing protein n=1 Tax=Toxocara canis TaxID=6265 RepID=A0A183U7R9_TOXCA|nr:unnamed protein product [Toxocara canis]
MCILCFTTLTAGGRHFFKVFIDDLDSAELNISCKWEDINKLREQICEAIKKAEVARWEGLSFGLKQCTEGLNVRITAISAAEPEAPLHKVSNEC